MTIFTTTQHIINQKEQEIEKEKRTFNIKLSINNNMLKNIKDAQLKIYNKDLTFNTIDIKDKQFILELNSEIEANNLIDILNQILYTKQNDYKKYFRMKWYFNNVLKNSIKKYKRPERSKFYFELIKECIIEYMKILTPQEALDMLLEMQKHGFEIL